MALGVRNRLIVAGVNSIIKGPATSWIFSSFAVATFNWLRRKGGRTEIIDLSGAGVGDKFVIEHLPITHKQQIKQMKKRAKADKREAKISKTRDRQAEKAAVPSRATRRQMKRRQAQLNREQKAAEKALRAQQKEEAQAIRAAKAQVRSDRREERRNVKVERAQLRADKRAAKEKASREKALQREARQEARAVKKAEKAQRARERAERKAIRKAKTQVRRDNWNQFRARRLQKRADKVRSRLERD